MADSKQANLNGAYYGPPVPPRHSSRSVGRGSSCCCGPCCLLCTIFKFLLSIVVTLGVIVLILWLVFRPNAVKVYVEEASLARFDLSANGTLAYTLNMTVSVRNPNRRIKIYYDYIEARAIYDGSRFGFTTLPPFYQGRKNTSMLYPLFNGQQLALGTVATTFNREKGEGTFNIDVKVHTKVRFKVWFIKSNKYTPDVDCSLKFPVPTASGSPSKVQRTKCDVDLF
ncbi:hypothetical protein Taro_055560 [Colocasia esculenta]|uniref:Late embryogenesis abundant protein LEA-2 subgroup domain-containing protein n=1 Tax=Colocasia esculenta TaxID=4460 RepID=A0A843XUM9_COLES|nr:hypothetical protein [Colocasia esculenta]